MSASVLYMSMSLDGYIAAPNDNPGNPGGDGFFRLHEWGFDADGQARSSGPVGELNREMLATGAVLAGRRTAEQVDHWGGDHHGRGVPIFVPSHRPPGRDRRELSVGDVRARRDRQRDGTGQDRRR